jgi:iron complex transport system substrate-binding protein
VSNKNSEDTIFTKENLTDAVNIWSRSAIAIIDIRYDLISYEKEIIDFRIPESMFLYVGGGKAEITLDEALYSIERFGMFHSGKGTRLSLRPDGGRLEYYMILYKDREPPFYKRELVRLLEKTNPFQQQYGFSPQNPVFFGEQMKKMFESWEEPTPLDLFYEKAAFYQLVYEIYKELYKGEVEVFTKDVAALAKYYIEEHCKENISIQQLSATLHVSTSYLRSIFKQRIGKSPQEYLIYCRLEQAKMYLSETDYSLKEIGTSLGFYDEYHFSTAFKKNTGLTPNSYRAIFRSKESDCYIGNIRPFTYNNESLVRLAKLKEKGEYTVIKQSKNKTVIAAVLSMMLLLSACSTAPVNTNGTDSVQTQTADVQVQDTGETRVIKTEKGDIEIPANPQRVISTYGMGDIIALGVTPIATYDAKGKAYEKVVEEVPVWGAFEAEEIMTYNPDLILVISEEQYEEVSKIAPTVLIPFTELSMEERVTFLGEVLNKKEEAEKVLADFKAKVDKARDSLSESEIIGKTFSIFEASSNGGVWVYGDKWGRGGDLIYKHLELKAPEVIQNEIVGGDQYRDVSLETIADYAGDYIVFSGEIGELTDSPVWQAVPAVKAGHVIPIDYTLFFDIDIYSSNVQLDYIMDKLQEITN